MTGNTVEAKDIRVGDKVRVTYIYEGVVDEAESRSFHFAKFRWHNDFAPQGGTKTIEILERALPKVGDVVMGSDLGPLPPGTVIKRDSSFFVSQKFYENSWFRPGLNLNGPTTIHSNLQYRIIHIPGSE